MATGESTFECSSCGKRFRWKPELADKRVRCKCNEVVHVPAQSPLPQDTPTRQSVPREETFGGPNNEQRPSSEKRSPSSSLELPAYKRISATFKIDKQKYFGMGVASPDALYLIMTQVRSDTALALGGAFGLVGGLVAGAIAAKGAKKNQPVSSCTVGELDTDIVDHPDWPFKVKPKEENKQVFIINKGGVELVEHPKLTNLLKFNVGDTAIKVEYLPLRGKSIREYLTETGWPMNWAGELVNTR